MDGWNGPSRGRIPPMHQLKPAQEYQDRVIGFLWVSATRRPLTPKGNQVMLPTHSGAAKYLAYASGSQSGGVYHIYQELPRPSLYPDTPAPT